MDNFEAVDKALGGYNASNSNIQDVQSLYSYGDKQEVDMITRNDNGTETPITIGTRKPGMTTSRGITIGSSRDELMAAYGTPNGKHPHMTLNQEEN